MESYTSPRIALFIVEYCLRLFTVTYVATNDEGSKRPCVLGYLPLLDSSIDRTGLLLAPNNESSSLHSTTTLYRFLRLPGVIATFLQAYKAKYYRQSELPDLILA